MARRSKIICSWAVVAALFLSAQAEADTIRLKDGRILEGQVIKEDGVQVVIKRGAQTLFFLPSEIESIARGPVRRSLRSLQSPAEAALLARRIAVDYTPLDRLRERLLVPQEFFEHFGRTFLAVRRQEKAVAIEEARWAATALLPFEAEGFNFLSFTMDLIVFVLIQAPILWVILRLAREPRSFMRLVQFLWFAYGVLVLVLTFLVVPAIPFLVEEPLIGSLVAGLLGIGIIGFFIRFFELEMRPAVLMLATMLSLNLGLSYSLFALQAL